MTALYNAEVYRTETYRLPSEPPVGTVVVECPDRGGPFWTRIDSNELNHWHQNKRCDHRDITWGEVLIQAGGMVQILPSANVA